MASRTRSACGGEATGKENRGDRWENGKSERGEGRKERGRRETKGEGERRREGGENGEGEGRTVPPSSGVYPDQTAPELGLHYLPRYVCPKTRDYLGKSE